MVEGGADVIRSFLAAASPSTISSPAVDAIIVTVAPMFVGDAGVGYGRGLRTDQVKCLRTPIFEVYPDEVCVATEVGPWEVRGVRQRFCDCDESTVVTQKGDKPETFTRYMNRDFLSFYALDRERDLLPRFSSRAGGRGSLVSQPRKLCVYENGRFLARVFRTFYHSKCFLHYTSQCAALRKQDLTKGWNDQIPPIVRPVEALVHWPV